jgi:hypothetical protein
VTTGTLALTNTTTNTNGPTLTIADGGTVEAGTGTLDHGASTARSTSARLRARRRWVRARSMPAA